MILSIDAHANIVAYSFALFAPRDRTGPVFGLREERRLSPVIKTAAISRLTQVARQVAIYDDEIAILDLSIRPGIQRSTSSLEKQSC